MPNTPAIDVSIIIVSTNERDFVWRCLDSIAKSRTRHTVETIVIDNASGDGTTAMVRRDFPNTIVEENDHRWGYIRNNNRAMEIARGRYLLVLNADIELQPDTLDVMVNFMDAHPDAGVSSCRLVYPDGTLQLSCRRFPTPWTYVGRLPHFLQWLWPKWKPRPPAHVARYLMLDYDHRQVRRVDWFLSAFFMLRRAAVEQVGKFDEGLIPPFYLEDVEWCFRARISGWTAYYVPHVQALHHHRQDSVRRPGRLSLVHLGNVLLFFAKHGRTMIRVRREVSWKSCS